MGTKMIANFTHYRSRGVTSHFTKDIKRKQITLILKKEVIRQLNSYKN
jgi:hypothetical protein